MSFNLTPMFHKEFRITNLTCEACVKLSTMSLKGIDGVTDATVDLKSGHAVLVAQREISSEEIRASLKEVDKETDL